MGADTRSIRDAWLSVPSPGEAGAGLERFTGHRMERILAIVAAIGSSALGLQALLAATTTISRVDAPRVALMLLVFGPLLWMIVACISAKTVRAACGTFAVAYVIGLLLWPVIVDRATREPSSQPWIFFLVNIAVIAAMLAFPPRLQVLWAAGMPFVYGYVRLVEGDFSQQYWITTAFDVSFTLILGLVIVSLGWMFRQVAAGVDEARDNAVATYARAAAATAAEEERGAMSALMHDSVLAALIAAERASSERERDLAVVMAREALTRLANTEALLAREGNDEPVHRAQVVAELRRTLSEQGVDAVVEERGPSVQVPGRVARALVLAARQAISNALMHAGGRGLHVVAETTTGHGLVLSVIDTGPGFDPDAIGEDRLGIRASIVARMAAVAGTSEIRTDARGTMVVLGWEPA